MNSNQCIQEEEEILEKFEDRFNLFEASALSCVLETAILQLYIIDVGTCSSSPFHSNRVMRKKIRQVIKMVSKEIRETRTFKVICDKVKKEIEHAKMEIELPREITRNLQRIEYLRLKLQELDTTKEKEIIKVQEISAKLKDRIHEEATWSGIKLKYKDHWETAKQNQNRLKCQNATNELEQKLRESMNETKNEIRVHQETCKILELEQQELGNELNFWIQKYEKEKKNRDEKIKIIFAKRKGQQVLIRELRQLASYEERKQEIDEYLDFKRMVQLQKEREELINNMATRIQAWWRGIMVRSGLGSFKKKKKLIKGKKK